LGDYVLNVSIEELLPPPSNDTCAGAIDVGSGGRFTGSTEMAANDYEARCAGRARSPDVVYYFDLADTSNVEINTNGSNYDTALYMDTRCGGSRWCDDDSGEGTRSRIRVNRLPPGRYYIIVDGYSRDRSGNYVLNVQIW
jgi:hypothetical protein